MNSCHLTYNTDDQSVTDYTVPYKLYFVVTVEIDVGMMPLSEAVLRLGTLLVCCACLLCLCDDATLVLEL